MDIFAVAGGAAEVISRILAQEEPHEVGFQINLFWIIAQAASFLIFLVILYFVAFKRIGGVLEERRSRIEQGLRDADQARVDREQAAAERLRVLADARTEAEDILVRAQRVAEESRERDMAETRAQLEQMRERAAADIVSEKERALADVRSQVADLALAAAARVVGETMNTDRERRLVEEFLNEVGTATLPGRQN
ncbi:MAG TPA: F0F1 ATP synthase subunit B [Candidatus Limnocylindrales bacterium]|nr:F0F1 ATP synthase subunit B [Candidatus Limnocylindrales bacterium]